MSRAFSIELWLREAEGYAAAIAADKRLPQIRDIQTDAAWKQWIAEAIDPRTHRMIFDSVRICLRKEAFDEAETKLRRFDIDRMMLAQMCAQWDATAQPRRARKPRQKRAGWQRAVAEDLRTKVGGTKKEQWAAIPEGRPGRTVPFNGDEIDVYREGDRLRCDDTGESVSFETFHRTYLKKSRKVSG